MRAIKAILTKNLITFSRDKGRIFGTLIMPLFMLFIFSFVMGSSAVDVDSPMNYLIAGVVIMIVFQGVFNHSTAVLNDISSGFMKEIVVAPIDRKYIAIGNILSASVLATVQGVMVLVVSFALGFRTTLPNFLLMVVLMLLSGVVLSAIALFLSIAAKNQANFQMLSSLALMPAMFLSGAYIPITIMPKIILPLVYINPLTYLTGAFRYIALGMSNLSTDELIRQGVAYRFGDFIITPTVSWIFVLVIGFAFFMLCVQKFRKVNLAEIHGFKGKHTRC